MKLRDQLLYVKHFMNKDIDNKSLYISSNTVLKYKETLIGILELDKEKQINVGTWVAVVYQDNWFPGEVVEILSNTSGLEYKINFMKPKRSNSNACVWPNQKDYDSTEAKFILYSHFDMLPTTGLRYFIIPEYEDIEELYTEYKNKYF